MMKNLASHLGYSVEHAKRVLTYYFRPSSRLRIMPYLQNSLPQVSRLIRKEGIDALFEPVKVGDKYIPMHEVELLLQHWEIYNILHHLGYDTTTMTRTF